MLALALLAFTPLVASSGSHPIEKVMNLLAKLKDDAIEQGKQEEVSFGKSKYWCSTSTSELDKAIEEEKATIDELESSIEGFKQQKKALEDQIKELEDEIKDLQAAATAAKNKDKKRNDAYKKEKKDLQDTIKGMKDAITALQGASKTDSALLQEGAQNSVREVLAFLSMKTSDEQRDLLMDFVSGRPDQLADGDLNTHVKKYSFKSDNVIDLLKELKLKFEDDLTASDATETNGANSYAVEKSARDNAETAATKSKGAKSTSLSETETSLTTAQNDLKSEKDDLKADSDTLEKTVNQCKTSTAEWEERSKTRSGEVAALTEGIKILAKVSGVRSEQPGNPVPPPSPVDFLQIAEDPKSKAVNLLRETAKTVHSKALERLALEVSTHLTGPFDKVNDMIQKMIFRLMSEQTDEDKHKAWCDLELEKTQKSDDEKTAHIKDLDAKIKADNARVAKLTLDIKDADDMVADVTKFIEESTEIRQTGKRENKAAIKDSKAAQSAIANAISVLEDFYKSSGQIKKEPWEFIQKGPVKLAEDPALWSQSYSAANPDPANAETGVIAVLEACAADFSKMEAETKAQEAEDQKKYDDSMSSHKTEKARRRDESAAKVSEKKNLIAKVEAQTQQKKHTSDELEAVQQYNKDLQPACVDGDSTFADRKASRAKEIKALKSAQGMLQDAFKAKSFLQVKRHA